MVTPELSSQHMEAAKDFANSLEHLGLPLDGVLWGYDHEDERHILIVITDVFDTKGPLEISRQLFKAYNAALTPKDIDPFIVRLLSTNHLDAQSLLKIPDDWTAMHYKKGTSQFAINNNLAKGTKIKLSEYSVSDVTIKPDWVVMIKPTHTKRKSHEINRKWEFFKKNIERRAA